MPNHVRNVLKFSKLKSKDIELLLNTIATQIERPKGSLEVFNDYAIDFDKIIPEPKDESDCPDDCKVNKDSHVEEDKDRPWFDWYAWRNTYWGTKWGAYDCYSKAGKSCITFVFSTAWSAPFPIYERLQLLGYNFEVRYADEDIGSNCGIITYNKTDGTIHYNEYEMAHPEQFARRLWNTY